MIRSLQVYETLKWSKPKYGTSVVGPGGTEWWVPKKENWAGISSFSIYSFHANKYLLSTCYVLGIIPVFTERMKIYLCICIDTEH